MAQALRRCALLCAILFMHLLVFHLISASDSPGGLRRSEEVAITLFWVDEPKATDTQQPSPHSASRRSTSSHRPRLDASDNTINMSPEIAETDARIDWDAEASRVARDAVERIGEREQLRSLDQHPSGLGALSPSPSRHELGDSQHFEGGVIIDWTNDHCYYSNQDAPIPAFGPALRLQVPICTGAGGASGKPLPSLEEWKKEQANQ